MTIEFGSPDQMWCDVHSMEVRHEIRVYGAAVRCRIAPQAIDDRFGVSKTDADRLAAAQQQFDQITDRWGLMIQQGRFQPDGSVLIDSAANW
jgi:hypothetical protein